LFGHYPTSSIVSPSNFGIRNVINGPYFSGHFHTLGGLVQQMFSIQDEGFLEIELADWKDKRRYRLAAIDHGLFSLTDVTLGQLPLILITNPKAALLTMPELEPIHRIAKSTHVRVLVFSTSAISSVQLKVSDGDWSEMSHVNGPLYVHSWDASQYGHGLHWMQVKAIVIIIEFV